MRAFEIATLVTAIPLFLWPFFPTRDRRRWIGFLLALPALFAALHLTLEGPRWQMVPAYALVVLLLLWTTLRLLRPAGERAGRKRWAIVLSGLGLLFLAGTFALPLLFPIFRLPRPSGPYRVGTVTYHWLDAGRDETFSDDPADHRELMVQIWYPAEGVPGAVRAPYLSHSDVIAPLLAQVQFGLPPFVFSHLRYVRANAVPGAPVATAHPRYHVLLFSHGRGGLRVQNTFQVEELASHGYVVAAIDHTYAAAATVFPDGRVVSVDPRVRDKSFLESKFEILANDARFVLDRLEALDAGDPQGVLHGRLDLGRVGIFGHSLGGIVAAEACRLDGRFQAGMDIDAFVPQDVIDSALAQPFMFITRDVATMEQELASEDPEERRKVIDEQMDSIQALFDRLQDTGYLVEIHGLFHFSATDLPLWTPLTSALGLTGPIDASRAHRIINAYTLAFFDHHLSGQAAPLLDGPSPDYPEVAFAVHRPEN
jgi:predicted dienelactone hydrolase